MDHFLQEIGMPEEVSALLLALEQEPSLLGESSDPLGFHDLYQQLCQAKNVWAVYQQLGISRKIYRDTMAAFARFVREHKACFGFYGFDRSYWTVRQLSCRLFRIGQLEYCLEEDGGKKAVSLHIPSDASLAATDWQQSFADASSLFRRVFPDYSEVPIVSESWLFSPELKKLLPSDSHILQFQRQFAIASGKNCLDDVLQWVFQRPNTSLEQLPEHTFLQRSLKKFLLNGGVIHEGFATRCASPVTTG